MTRKTDHECEECGDGFVSKRALSEHKKNKHPINSSDSEIEYGYDSDNSYLEEKPSTPDYKRKKSSPSKQESPKKRKKTSTESKKKETKKSSPSKKKLNCPTCNKVFAYQGFLDNHLKNGKCVEDLGEGSSRGVKPTKKRKKVSKLKDNGKKHECNICGKSFARKSSLEGHELLHISDAYDKEDLAKDDDEFVCSEGELSSEDEDVDEKKQSSIKKSFTCKSCNFVCFSKQTYDKHVTNHVQPSDEASSDSIVKVKPEKKTSGSNVEASTSVVKDYRMFDCNECDRSFSCLIRLKKHKVAHDSDYTPKKRKSKQFECQTCQKKFSTKAYFEKHEKRHEGPFPDSYRGLQSFTCEYCDQTFTCKKSIFLKHVHSHTPEVCGICDKRFTDRAGLREHCKEHVNTEEGRLFMQCSQKALDAKNGVAPPEPKVEYIYLVLR